MWNTELKAGWLCRLCNVTYIWWTYNSRIQSRNTARCILQCMLLIVWCIVWNMEILSSRPGACCKLSDVGESLFEAEVYWAETQMHVSVNVECYLCLTYLRERNLNQLYQFQLHAAVDPVVINCSPAALISDELWWTQSLGKVYDCCVVPDIFATGGLDSKGIVAVNVWQLHSIVSTFSVWLYWIALCGWWTMLQFWHNASEGTVR